MLIVCMLSSTLVLVTGCQSYRDGSSRTVGEITDDSGIQAVVKSKLLADEQIRGLRINIEVHKGIVELYGSVQSDYARRRAITLAESVAGVVEVQDKLTLVPN